MKTTNRQWVEEVLFNLCADYIMAVKLNSGDTGVDKAAATINQKINEELEELLDEIRIYFPSYSTHVAALKIDEIKAKIKESK